MNKEEAINLIAQIRTDINGLEVVMDIIDNISHSSISDSDFDTVVRNINIPNNYIWETIKPNFIDQEEETFVNKDIELPEVEEELEDEDQEVIPEDDEEEEDEDTEEEVVEEETVEIVKPIKESLSDSIKKIGRKYE